MSNGNKEFTKIYTETQSDMFDSIQSDLVQTTVLQSTIINGDQYTTVTGYVPTSFATLAAASAATCALMTLPNQTAATSITDNRLLVLPARSVITKVVLSDNATGLLPVTNTIAVAFLPTITPSVLTIAAQPASTATGCIIGTSTAGTGASGANLALGTLTIFSAVNEAVTAVTAGLARPLSTAGIGNTYPYIVSKSFVNIYNTTAAAANTAGNMKVQITYLTCNL